MDYTIRPLETQDEPILWTMLMYAAHENSRQSIQNQPSLARYVQDWGRVGDLGFVACMDEVSIGAVWLRLWSGSDRGFGYLDDTIPELAIAVLPEYRGQGVGTKLLKQMITTASNTFPAICLSVRGDNPAISLYQRVGFLAVEGSEAINRVSGVSFNMLKKLR